MDDSENFTLQLQWAGDMVSPPTPVNQMLLMADSPAMGEQYPDSHTIAFGYVVPPAIPGELSREQVDQLQREPLPIVPVGRFVFTTSRLRELRNVIDQHLQRTGAPD